MLTVPSPRKLSALTLLEKGYSVRGTVRSQAKADTFAKLPRFAKYVESGKLTFTTIEDVASSDFTKALEGVEAVMHTASPFHLGGGDPWEVYLKPAIEGTLNVVKAAEKSGSVKNLIITSSFAAVLSLDDPKIPFNSKVYTEADWNNCTLEQAKNPEMPAAFAYSASKKFAEKSAFDYQKEHNLVGKIHLAALNPPMVMGPAIQPFDKLDQLGESAGQVWKLVSGQWDKEIPPTGFPLFVDVRDLGDAHVLALEKNIQGRVGLFAGNYDHQSILDLAHAKFPTECKATKGTPGSSKKDDPTLMKIDTTKAQKELGLKFRTHDETFADAIRQLYDDRAAGKA